MRTPKVKICGITNETDLTDAVSAGADAVGFVVGVRSSPRNLSTDKARSLLAQVPPFVSGVIVTRESDPNDLVRLYSSLKPNLLQIYCEISKCKVLLKGLKEVAVILGVDAENCSVEDLIEISGSCKAILLDTLSTMGCGGTGRVHDWNASRRLRQAIDPTAVILAGGLNPENVTEAIRTVEPYAVDVASGVESSLGKKDRAKMIRFVKNAKSVQI